MKKISLMIVIVLSLVMVFGCVGKPVTDDDNKDLVAKESNVFATYVGSFSRAGGMGLTHGGHTIILYKDGTTTIYAAFSMAMGGVNGKYTGVWELDEKTNCLSITYVVTDTNQLEQEHKIDVVIKNNAFEALIWLVASMPTITTTYYEIADFKIDNEDAAYLGVHIDEGGDTIISVLLLDEETFILYLQKNEDSQKVEGTYKIITGDVENPDILELTSTDEITIAQINFNNDVTFIAEFLVIAGNIQIRLVRFLGE